MNTLKNSILQLKKKGYRSSKVRNVLVEVLYRGHEPLAVADFQEIFTKKKISVNRTTLYRELNLLTKEGILVELQLKDGKRRYELADRDHHHHVVCIECQKVEDIVGCHSESFEKEVLNQTKNFVKIINHTSDFFGLCKICMKS